MPTLKAGNVVTLAVIPDVGSRMSDDEFLRPSGWNTIKVG